MATKKKLPVLTPYTKCTKFFWKFEKNVVIIQKQNKNLNFSSIVFAQNLEFSKPVQNFSQVFHNMKPTALLKSGKIEISGEILKILWKLHKNWLNHIQNWTKVSENLFNFYLFRTNSDKSFRKLCEKQKSLYNRYTFFHKIWKKRCRCTIVHFSFTKYCKITPIFIAKMRIVLQIRS